MNPNLMAIVKNSFAIESECLAQAFSFLDGAEFEKAVAALCRAERIAASGCGHSGIACRHSAHLMCCVERPARFISPAEAVHGATGFLLEGDVILLASRGGKTEELLPILDICKTRGRYRDLRYGRPRFPARKECGYRASHVRKPRSGPV